MCAQTWCGGLFLCCSCQYSDKMFSLVCVPGKPGDWKGRIRGPWFNNWEISHSEKRLTVANWQPWGASSAGGQRSGFSATSPMREGKKVVGNVKVSWGWGYPGLCPWKKDWFFSYRSSLKYDTGDPIQKCAKKKRHGGQLQVRPRSPTPVPYL